MRENRDRRIRRWRSGRRSERLLAGDQNVGSLPFSPSAPVRRRRRWRPDQCWHLAAAAIAPAAGWLRAVALAGRATAGRQRGHRRAGRQRRDPARAAPTSWRRPRAPGSATKQSHPRRRTVPRAPARRTAGQTRPRGSRAPRPRLTHAIAPTKGASSDAAARQNIGSAKKRGSSVALAEAIPIVAGSCRLAIVATLVRSAAPLHRPDRSWPACCWPPPTRHAAPPRTPPAPRVATTRSPQLPTARSTIGPAGISRRHELNATAALFMMAHVEYLLAGEAARAHYQNYASENPTRVRRAGKTDREHDKREHVRHQYRPRGRRRAHRLGERARLPPVTAGGPTTSCATGRYRIRCRR